MDSDHWPASPKETSSGSEVAAWYNGKNRASKPEGSDEPEGLRFPSTVGARIR